MVKKIQGTVSHKSTQSTTILPLLKKLSSVITGIGKKIESLNAKIQAFASKDPSPHAKHRASPEETAKMRERVVQSLLTEKGKIRKEFDKISRLVESIKAIVERNPGLRSKK